MPGVSENPGLTHPRISIYKIFVALGIYAGVMTCVFIAKNNGIAPVPLACGVLGCAIAGLAGARVYHLLLLRANYHQLMPNKAWDTASGGGSLFGGLLAMILVSPAMAFVARLTFAVFWDYLSTGLLIGAIFTRCGCFFNGCCGGRETTARFGFHWYNHRGEWKRRIPVPLLEIAWLGLAAFVLLRYFQPPQRAGNVALSIFAWYGLGRAMLEPFREEPDTVRGIRANLVAAMVLFVSAALLLIRANY